MLDPSLNSSQPALARQFTKSKKSKSSDQTVIEGLKQFNKYGDLFQDLTRRTWVDTLYDVVSIIITLDSKHCIAIVSMSDECYEVQGYDLDKASLCFKKDY